jgi:AcrR family transcriptional regulator
LLAKRECESKKLGGGRHEDSGGTGKLIAPRKRNQRGQGALLRSELITAAMRILDRSPTTSLSLRMVAKEAGVAAPSVYAHFTDVRDLMTEIVRECWRQLAEQMGDGIIADGTGREALTRQLCAYVRYAMERPSRYQMLFAMQPMDMAEPHDIPGIIQPAFRKVRDALRAIRDAGGAIPGENSFSAALLVLSVVHGRIALAHLAPWREGNSAAGVEAFVSEVLERLLRP